MAAAPITQEKTLHGSGLHRGVQRAEQPAGADDAAETCVQEPDRPPHRA